MLIQPWTKRTRYSRADAFSLVEALLAFTVLALSVGGIVYGYAQVNRMALWCSMSLAAQSYALQGMEQARAAQWNPWDFSTNTGPWTENQITATPFNPSIITQIDLLDIPIKGNPFSTNANGAFTNTDFYVTNIITVSTVTNYGSGASFPANLREIESQAIWIFPYTGQLFTNTVVTLRASDQ